MTTRVRRSGRVWTILAVLLLVLGAGAAHGGIDGVTGTSFQLTARADNFSTPDGGAIMFWGYAEGSSRAQYPGPTLIVSQGSTVTIGLKNTLDVPVSMVFPGQEGVTAMGGSAGLLTQEAAAGGGTVTYTFTADRAGTYMYHSGTRPELQIEMGLVGALIVRPYTGDDHAYNHADARFEREYLFLLSEMDSRIHELVATQGVAALEGTDYLSNYFPNYWFINGRPALDSLFPAGVPWLPTQPYGSLVLTHPGEKTLLRFIGAGRHSHPFHTHGNHARTIARDGFLLSSGPGAGADLSQEEFTFSSVPGQTLDAIFEWTGREMGWDIYGDPDDPDYAHTCIDGDADDFDDGTSEYCPDHGKPIPVGLPEKQDLTFGGFWSGSPYLGTTGSLPPGEGGLNPNGGFGFMWHSHAEKELLNFDIFPGGMMTMLIIEAPGVPLP